MLVRLVLLIFIVCFHDFIWAKSIDKTSINSRWRTSFELMPISSPKDMGLLGLHYDIFPFESCKQCYMGIGGYSGASGEEGGFFTAGLTGGYLHSLTNRVSIDTGLHIGGGGGSDATYPGGGLIVRSHVGMQYRYKIGFNLGVANMSFPNSTKSDKSDTHIYAGIIIPDNIWVDSVEGKSGLFSGSKQGFRVAPAFLYYKPVQRPITKAGGYTSGSSNDDIPLMGIQLSWHNGNVFFPLEMYGAAGGGVDGYATLFSGIGYQTQIANGLSLEGKALVGVGGDGRLDTGGGALLQPMAGMRVNLTDSLSLAAMFGKNIGLDGQFEASCAELSVAWRSDKPKASSGISALFDHGVFNIDEWYGSLSNKTYFPAGDVIQTDGESFDSQLHLFGVELEKPISENFSFIGNTYWAHTGNIGSYAEGAIGIKGHMDVVNNLNLFAQTNLAVAGGGDVEVDRGFLIAGEIGIGYRVLPNMYIDLSGGYTQSSNSSFKASVLTVKLRWLSETIFYK